MPLITKSRPASELVPERERSRFKRLSISLSHSIYRTSANSSQSNIIYGSSASSSKTNVNEESMDDSASTMDRPRPKRAMTAPMLPPKSELRASRLLTNLTSELEALGESNITQISTEDLSDPLEQYLSSEEDASENADDYYEESMIEFDTASISTQHTRRDSKQDTARVVSYTFVGKPSIVEISTSEIPAPRQRQSYMEPKNLSKLRPKSMQVPRTIIRPESPAPSTTSFTPPPRKSSRTRPTLTITNSMTSTPGKNSFLGSDPFPTPTDSAIDLQSPMDISSPRVPSDKWKAGFRTVSRSFSFARRPSMPRMSVSYNAASSIPKTATAPSFPHTPITPRPASAESQPETHTIIEEEIEADAAEASKVNYQDIMKNVVKVGPAPSAAAAKAIKHKSSMLGLGRKRSLRGRS